MKAVTGIFLVKVTAKIDDEDPGIEDLRECLEIDIDDAGGYDIEYVKALPTCQDCKNIGKMCPMFGSPLISTEENHLEPDSYCSFAKVD